MFNAGAERLFGCKATEISGQSLAVLFAGPDDDASEDDAGRIAEGGITDVCPDGRKEMIAVHRSGRQFPVEISVAETVVAGDRIHTILVHDISERKRWEEELRRAMHLADTANRAKSEFLSHMSHELRTPLNGILGYAEFIKDKWLGDDALDQYVEYAGFISDSGQHLLQLINDILDLSKVESGQYKLRFEEFDIDALFEECRHIVAAEAQKAEVTINFENQPASRNWTADRRAIKQILINLLSNAVKFSHPEGTIEVQSSRDETGAYRLLVRDFGVGMTESEARRALEPFVQVERSYVAQQRGTGLGLTLVARLAALHGGQVDIDSKPEQGTSIRVTVPPLTPGTEMSDAPERLSA